MFFPIAIVFSEDVICDELEKMKQVLHDGGYDPSYLSPPPFESVLGLLASRVLQRAQELGIEVEDYKPSLCTTDKGEQIGRVIFEFPDQLNSEWFKYYMT
jgi:hypothetical protein